MLNCLEQIHGGVDVGGRTCRTHGVPNKRLLICFTRKRRRARLGSRPIRNRLARLDVPTALSPQQTSMKERFAARLAAIAREKATEQSRISRRAAF